MVSSGTNKEMNGDEPPLPVIEEDMPAPPAQISEKNLKFHNSTVQSILEQLKDFDFEEYPSPNLNEADLETRPAQVLDNGSKYEGQWIKGSMIRQGKANITWVDGSNFQGWVKDDKASGFGRLIHADGDVYMGTWYDDKAYGLGTY